MNTTKSPVGELESDPLLIKISEACSPNQYPDCHLLRGALKYFKKKGQLPNNKQKSRVSQYGNVITLEKNLKVKNHSNYKRKAMLLSLRDIKMSSKAKPTATKTRRYTQKKY